MQYLKSILLFLILITVLGGLVLINYYHLTIPQFAQLPWYSIPGVSLIFVVLFSLLVTEHEHNNHSIRVEFVKIITHSFRTPITALKWSITNLHKNISQKERDDLLNVMERTTDKLMEIINIISTGAEFDKRLNYFFEAASLREMVEYSLEHQAEAIRQKNLHLQIDSGKQLPLVIIDKRKIQFVLDVLIDNAIRYTPNNGSIAIDFGTQKDSLLLRISDTGIGIGYFDLSRIFRGFYRSEAARAIYPDGLGLSLSNAQKIVQVHGGKLSITSAGKNRGTIALLSLKIKQ